MTASASKHIISILLANEAGVLSRVAGLFSARAYNIESLTVAPTNKPSLSRVTIVSQGGAEIAEQIVKQLHKLIDVVEAVDLSSGEHVEQEALLVKLACTSEQRGALEQFVSPYHAKLIVHNADSCIVSMNDTSAKIEEFIDVLEKEWTITEIARSGATSLACSQSLLAP